MHTRNVVISDRQAAFIEQLVEYGEYQNASEVLREGLRLVEERRAAYATHVQALRDAAQLGIDAMEAERYTTFESVDVLRQDFEEEAERIRKANRILRYERRLEGTANAICNVLLTPSPTLHTCFCIRKVVADTPFGKVSIGLFAGEANSNHLPAQGKQGFRFRFLLQTPLQGLNQCFVLSIILYSTAKISCHLLQRIIDSRSDLSQQSHQRTARGDVGRADFGGKLQDEVVAVE